MAVPIRQPLAIYAGDTARWCAPYGNDANDGYDGWRYPKKTFLSAYDSLPAEGGTIHVMDGTYTGGEVAGQGIWLTAGTLYPGWRALKKVIVYGYGSSAGLFSYPTARIYPGQPGVAGRPDERFDVGLWITGGGTMEFNNLLFGDTDIFVRLGVDGNPALDPDAPAQRGVDDAVALIVFNQVVGQINSYSGRDGGPGFDIGYGLWIYFNQCCSNMPTDQSRLSDRRAGFLIKPGEGSSQLYWKDCRGAQGGIIYYNGPSEWSIDVDSYLVESDGNQLPPVVWLRGLTQFGNGRIRAAFGADAGAGGSSNIVIDAPTAAFTPSQLVIENEPYPPQGSASALSAFAPATLLGGINQSFVLETSLTPAAQGQQGFWGNRLWGNSDIARNASPVITNRALNYWPQRSGGTGDGASPVNPPSLPHDASRVWTELNVDATGGDTCVDAPIRDQLGSNLAIQISTPSGSQEQKFWYASRPVAAGDYIIAGAWVRFPSGEPSVQPVNLQISFNAGTGTLEEHTAMTAPYITEGSWVFMYGWAKVLTASGGAFVLVNFNVAASVGKATVVDRPFVYDLLAADGWTANEAGALIQNLAGSFVQGPLGMATTQPGQVLCAQGGLAVGNAASATTPGSVVSKMQVFAADGTSLGYVPIYNAIT